MSEAQNWIYKLQSGFRIRWLNMESVSCKVRGSQCWGKKNLIDELK